MCASRPSKKFPIFFRQPEYYQSDSSSAHRAVAALPDLAAITEKQQIVTKAITDIVSSARTFSGNTLGHGANQNETAQLVGHFLLGATLAYINGGDPLSGGSAAVAAEKSAQYLSQQYNDGQTAIDPQTGEFNPNLLPEHIKDEIKSTTGVIASIVGATGDGGSALNAQIGGVLGQNAVENNWLHSQTAKQKGWLSQTEIALLDKLATQSGARSIEYFIQEEQKIRQSNMSGADKEKALANLKREYEADSRKMEAAAAKAMLRQLESIGLPDNSVTRKYLSQHLRDAYTNPSTIVKVQENGRVVRETLLMGPRGSVKFETIWDGNKLITGQIFGPTGRFTHGDR